MKSSRGFTLLEVLLVVALLAILAAIVIVAINPARQVAQANNAQRRSDVNAILNAVYQYAVDNNGSLPSALDAVTASSQVLGTDGSGCDSTCTAVTTVGACANFQVDLVATYLVSIPLDPQSGTAANTDYYINRDANDRVTVGTCDAQLSEAITVTR